MHPWLDLPVRLSRAPVVSIAAIRGVSAAPEASSSSPATCVRLARERGARPVRGRLGHDPGRRPDGPPVALGRSWPGTRDPPRRRRPDGPRAEQYGYVNRAIADDRLDDEVEALASRLARLDHEPMSRTKAYVDHVTLPPDREFPPALADFFEPREARAAGAAGRARRARPELDSDLERSLGRRVVRGASRTAELKADAGWIQSWAARPRAPGGSGSRVC